MKYSTIMIAFLAITVMGCSSNRTYYSVDQEKAAIRVQENLLNRDYTINVDRALPVRGRNVNLSGGYRLQVDRDYVRSYLPFYGRAYSVPYGGGEGLSFEGNIEDYSTAEGKKGSTVITFNVRTNEDRYAFNITVWENGSSDITVRPVNKQQMGFSGYMVLDR